MKCLSQFHSQKKLILSKDVLLSVFLIVELDLLAELSHNLENLWLEPLDIKYDIKYFVVITIESRFQHLKNYQC